MKENIRIKTQIKELFKEFLKQERIALGDAEVCLQKFINDAGAETLGDYWSEQAAANEPDQIDCECGGQLKKRQHQAKNLLTLIGQTRARRAYYKCKKCKQGRYLLDEKLGCRGRAQTGHVQECVALAVAENSYISARRLLSTLARLELAHHTLELIAQDVGGALQEQRDQQIVAAVKGPLDSQERPKTLCITTDGVKAPMRDGWREARVVAAFPYEKTPGGSEVETGRVSYSARIENCEATGKRMYAEAQLRGAQHAERIAVIGDGADWIWNQSQEHFPGAIEIVDWYHAIEHLWEVANVLFGQGTNEARQWEQACEAMLWEGQVKGVVKKIQTLFYARRRQEKNFHGSDAENVLHNNIAYFDRHAKRMNYAHFKREGLPIGSGTVESACKYLVAQRCKGSGMQWKEDGIHAVLEIRAALVSDEWHRVKTLLQAA